MKTDTVTHVALIDSGAGGLSIAKEIIQRELCVDITYVADHAYFPYGTLDDNVLISRLFYLVEKLHQSNYPPDVVIVACNTASTLALDKLRAKWLTPFIGVVPAIKPAIEKSKSKHIAVLATEATVERDYFNDLIKKFAIGIHVSRFGNQTLVKMVEDYLVNKKLDISVLHNIILNIAKETQHADHLVLACTHFPILKKEIEKKAEPLGIKVVDSTSAIVNRLCDILPGVIKKSYNNTLKDSSSYRLNLISSSKNTFKYSLKSYADYLVENEKYTIHLSFNF